MAQPVILTDASGNAITALNPLPTTGGGGGGGSDVNLVSVFGVPYTLGQHVMDASIPVVAPINQVSIPVASPADAVTRLPRNITSVNYCSFVVPAGPGAAGNIACIYVLGSGLVTYVKKVTVQIVGNSTSNIFLGRFAEPWPIAGTPVDNSDQRSRITGFASMGHVLTLPITTLPFPGGAIASMQCVAGVYDLFKSNGDYDDLVLDGTVTAPNTSGIILYCDATTAGVKFCVTIESHDGNDVLP